MVLFFDTGSFEISNVLARRLRCENYWLHSFNTAEPDEFSLSLTFLLANVQLGSLSDDDSNDDANYCNCTGFSGCFMEWQPEIVAFATLLQLSESENFNRILIKFKPLN